LLNTVVSLNRLPEMSNNSSLATNPQLQDSGSTPSSEAHRHILITWCITALLMNLTGNTIILLATTRCRARSFRLDRVSVLLIQNIAVSDVLMAVFGILPTLSSLITNKWPFGTLLCYMFHYIKVVATVSSVLLICAMHLSKLHTLFYPLHASGRSSRSAHLICAVTHMCAVRSIEKG